MRHSRRITGHANPGGLNQFKQISTADGAVTLDFYGFMAVNADATLTSLADIRGDSRLADLGGTTAYQNVYYPGSFGSIQVATGTVLIYLSEQ